MKIAGISRQQPYLTMYDTEVLKNFVRLTSQTLSDILTNNSMEGSKSIESLHKLVSFGLIRRDWEKELETKSDVVYTITPEGKSVGKGDEAL